MSYHSFLDDEGEEYGSFEVFFVSGRAGDMGDLTERGWYWWACFPGCLPDGDACGPFATEAEAYADARN